MSSKRLDKKKRNDHLLHYSGEEDAQHTESILSNKEKRHYTKALKEMQELVKLEGLRIQLAPSDSEYDTDNNEISEDYFSDILASPVIYKEYADKVSSHKKHFSKKENGANLMRKQRKVYRELCEISKGLQGENDRLKKWEADLNEERKENLLLKKKLQEYEGKLDELINYEAQKRCKEFEKAFETRIQETSEESKRTKLSFKIMKQANDSLKKQNSEFEEQNRKLENKVSTLNDRISNLQRKNELLKNEVNESRAVEKTKQSKRESEKVDISMEKRLKQIKAEVNALSETLGTCLDWIAESQLRQSVQTLIKSDTGSSSENDIGIEIVNEKAFKVIQHIPSLLQYVTNPTTQLSFLCFIYWSLLLAEYTQKGKSGLPLTAYRRIGEKLFKTQILRMDPASQDSTDLKNKKPDEASTFSCSINTRVRMLSELIILKTIAQADIIARVLEALKNDTRSEEGKEIFVTYCGSAVLISFLGGQHKGLLHLSVDVLMQMIVESPFMGQFLDSLSSQLWVRRLYDVFQSRSVDDSVMEKLSIIIQRLSKIKSNQKYFENVQFGKYIRELATNSDVERPFFALNLRSILLNLNNQTHADTNKKKLFNN